MATEAAASDGAAERKPPPPQPKNHAQKSLLRSEALYQYILETCVHPREPEALKELRHITAKHPWNIMAASADEVQFLSMLLKLVNAKKTLEIGVFTGYSLLATALALPDDGEIVAIDIDRASYENIGLPVIRKAGVAHKIDFRQGCALPILDQMIQEGKYKGWFDFVFVDADKRNYIEYHKRAMELVRVGGVVAYDNTLWGGTVVAPPEEPISAYMLQGKEMIMEMNKHLTADPRIDICLLSISDGLTLCRRLS